MLRWWSKVLWQYWNPFHERLGFFCYVILSETKNLVILLKEVDSHSIAGVEDFFLFLFCLRRDTFVQSYKSIQKNSSKNFSVILFVCWFSKQYEESLHPILLDSFSIFLTVISMQSDKWKIFGWRLFWIYFSNNTPYLIIY